MTESVIICLITKPAGSPPHTYLKNSTTTFPPSPHTHTGLATELILRILQTNICLSSHWSLHILQSAWTLLSSTLNTPINVRPTVQSSSLQETLLERLIMTVSVFILIFVRKWPVIFMEIIDATNKCWVSPVIPQCQTASATALPCKI